MKWCESGPAAADRSGNPLSVETVVFAPQFLRAMVDMLVWDSQDFEIDSRSTLREKFTDRRPEPAGDHVLFDRYEAGDPRGQREDPLFIERLREACIDDCGFETVARQDFRGLERGDNGMAVREDRDAVAFAERL